MRQHNRYMKAGDAHRESEIVSRNKLDELTNIAMLLLKEVRSLEAGERIVRVDEGIDLYDEVRRFEQNMIERALQHAHGSQTRAARLLGINVTTLNSKIKRFNMPMPRRNKITASANGDETGVTEEEERRDAA